MAEMLDCLVSYYSATAHRDGMPLQYVCYRVIGGPGPTLAGGVAVISLLGAKNPVDGDVYHRLHAVQAGGPRAALAAALSYLDAVHQKHDLARVQTEVRSAPCLQSIYAESGFVEELPESASISESDSLSSEAIFVLETGPRS
jgi:hypothetical protein